MRKLFFFITGVNLRNNLDADLYPHSLFWVVIHEMKSVKNNSIKDFSISPIFCLNI